MCGEAPAQNAGSQFAPAQAANLALQNNAVSQAQLNAPKTYQFDPNAANSAAAALSRTSVLQNQAALQARSPQAAAGQQAAINTLSGGVAGDDQFLRNEALKSGLEKGVSSGAVGANSITAPNSVGGVTAANVFGPELLNYRNQRAQQALGVASGLQPDASVNPGQALSMEIGGQQQAVQNQNSWQNYLNQLNFGQADNLESQTQQALGQSQANDNAQAQAANFNRALPLQVGTQVAGTAIGVAGLAL